MSTAFPVAPTPPSGGTNPLFEQFDVDLPSHRQDLVPVSLERRGVTSQISSPAHAADQASKSRRLDAQLEFWERLSIYTDSIVAKLDACGESAIADQIRDCHSEVSYKRCRGCSSVSKFYNRCEHKWCPLCAPRLARERRDSLRVWMQQVRQPKHVVLTCRNTEVLTKARVQWFKKCFGRLRRTVFAKGWRGGFYSLEVTNESRGWHLHCHAFIDADWISQSQLAIEWARIVGQEFAIVYVTGKQDVDYVAEVAKYLVKGSVLAKWSGEEVAAFVRAFTGIRCFQPFGSLLGERARVRELIRAILDVKPACQCGCSDFQILDENQYQEWLLHHGPTARAIPPPTPQLQLV